MNIKIVVVGMLNTNCYIIENNDKCLIIDPGDEFDKIKNNITKNVVGILLTHKHFDHVGAVKECADFYSVPIYCYDNLKEGKSVIDDFEFLVKFNPGHTLDSISFIFDNIMFCGDFIFKGCIGRCDLGGNFDLMKNSIKEILDSTKDYIIYPGHAESTTLNNERTMLESYIK